MVKHHQQNITNKLVSHVETPSTEDNQQTPNNNPIASTIPETQELIINMVDDFSLTVRSPEDEL